MNDRMFSWANIAKALREPRKALSILLHRGFAPFGHHKYKKFIVLTRDRTGSNMLIQSLNAHFNISSDYEIFGKLHGETEATILDRCFSKQPFYIKAKGFKIFYYHPQDAENSPIWDMLASDQDLHVIHLKRRNLLHVEVSSRVAYTTGVYGVRSNKENTAYQDKLAPVEFTHEDLLRLFKQNFDWEDTGTERFKGHQKIDVSYEDMVENLDGEYGRVLAFLGIKYRPPRTDFKKQRTKNMRDLVTDYDSLKAGFANTEWESFFDD
jgi:LPS sulfotransferase NodH